MPENIPTKVLKFFSTRSGSQLSILGIILGFAFGFIAKIFKPSNDILKVFSYPGSIFINSLKTVVLIFVIAIMMRTPMDMLEVGEAKKLGFLSITYYVSTSLLSSLVGLIFVNLIKPGTRKYSFCPLTSGMESKELQEVSLLETILDIGKLAIPPNVFDAIVKDNILGILTIFLTLGFFLSAYGKTVNGIRLKSLLDLFYQTILDMLEVIIKMTPLGVFSLIGGEIARIQDNCVFIRMLIYIMTFIAANLFHIFVSLNLIYYAVVRKNPFKYFVKFIPAFITSFSTASSAASMPLNLKGAYKAGLDKNTANFVLPLGSTLNMNGSSIYYPVTIVFISFMMGKPMGIAKQILCCFVATVVTVGGAPIPSGALVYLTLVASTVGVTLPHSSITLIWAVDPIMDRILTTTNVIGDSYAVEIVDVIYKWMLRNNKLQENNFIDDGSNDGSKNGNKKKAIENSALSRTIKTSSNHEKMKV